MQIDYRYTSLIASRFGFNIKILIFLVIAAVFVYFDRFADCGRRIVSQPREIVPRGNLAEYENSAISIFNVAAPSIVYIFTENAESGFFRRR
jgi:hypothetical protein